MRSLQTVLSADPQLAGQLTGWTLESGDRDFRKMAKQSSALQ